MFSDLKPYPISRDVGLSWLRSVPEGWLVERAKTLLKPVDLRSTDGEEELLTVSSARGIVRRSSATVSMFQATSYAGHKLCWPGDLVINSLWAWGRGLGVSTHHGIVSTAYGVYRSRNTDRINPDFLHELVRSLPFQWELQVRSRGVWKSRLQLTDDQFFCSPLPLPPMVEQAAIVKYLGHANARIDRAIAAKRKLIVLLEEQKQAIINQAVTRGLDPTVPHKDSGIRWLGQIPGHWRLPMLGRCLDRIEQGWSPNAAEGDLEPDQWAVLTLSSINRGVFNGNALKPIPTSREVPPNFEIHAGDLLMTRSNTRNRVGDVAIVSELRPRTILSDLIYRLSVNLSNADKHFVSLVLRSVIGRRQIEQDARGSSRTMPKISQGHIRSWRIPLPDLAEQRRIVKQTESETASIDAVVARSTRKIELLREFKTRLTADVVTGQLDIRDAAARLPELDPADLVSDVGTDEDELDAVLAESLEEVDA